jgi:hypothetical protein
MLKTFVIIFLYKVNIEITTVHTLAVKTIVLFGLHIRD